MERATLIVRLLIGAAVIAAIAASVLFGRTGARPEAVAPSAAAAEDPGYAATDAVIIETGDDGRPRYRLAADLIRQQPNDLTVSLDNPTLDYSAANGGTWRARAAHGTVPQDRQRIELTGDVWLSGTLPGSTEVARINTERLAFDTVTEVASTPEPVTIDWSGHRLAARGLRADLKGERLSLEGEVRGRFVR